MLKVPLPNNESDRIAALRSMRLLDTGIEERFERITRTVRRVFDVPIALISLVDEDRQWFKSRSGFEPAQTPRDISFCGHAIFSADLLVISDATADVRFADNPLVVGEQHLRFYAGVPLQGAGGHLVATLCLLDRVSREFNQADRAALRDLAAWAELELNLQTVSAANASSREKEAQLRAIVDNAGDGIITIDDRGRIETFNPAAARMFGYLPQQVVGEDFRRLLRPDFHAEAAAFLQRFTGEQGMADSQLHLEMVGVREDGSDFSAELVVTEMRLDGRRGFNGMVRDLTERKRIEQMKADFIANVSHELRTPLTSIRGALGLLAAGTLGQLAPQGQAVIDIAKNNCERLVRLVNDILDIEKIESGNMRFELTPQPLLPLVRQAMAATTEFAAQFKVTLVLVEDAACAGVLARLDADRITQVIVNLLSNAVKFSPPGGSVEVGVGLSKAQLRLTVTDHGSGIPEAFQSRVFQKFAQADTSDADRKGGTGLGLSISRTIIERHGGNIGFHSSPSGTEFYAELPVAAESGRVRAD